MQERIRGPRRRREPGSRPREVDAPVPGGDLEAETMPSSPLWPLLAYFGAVIFLVAIMLGLSYLLGPRHLEPQTGQPYEAGIVPTGTARRRVNVKYYLVAMFFVIFDLEAAFIFAWAVAARDLGWTGYAEVAVFIAILLAALVYLWRLGALDWETPRQRGQRLR